MSDTQYFFLVLYFICNSICNNIEEAEPVKATFLDLAKAFDSVNHKIVLQQLDNYEVKGISFDLIKSYLTKRYQYVSVNG